MKKKKQKALYKKFAKKTLLALLQRTFDLTEIELNKKLGETASQELLICNKILKKRIPHKQTLFAVFDLYINHCVNVA